MRRLVKLLIIIISLTVISSCEKSRKDVAETNLRYVIIEDVSPTMSTQTSSYAGTIEEGKNVNAAFMTGGKIAELKVKVGDRVRKGQLLATLDDKDYLIGVNQAKVQLDQMTKEKERMDEMYARHNVAPNDYEKLEAGYEQLRLQYDMALNKLNYTKLYSPSDGYVGYKYMQPGELVDAGTPIYKISDDTRLEVGVDLPLSVYLNRNEISGALGISPVLSEAIPLKIESFTPDADNNQLYHMRLSLPGKINSQLTSGMNMTVSLDMNVETTGETMVPSRAVFDENGHNFIWIFNENDSTISKKAVEVIGQPHGRYNTVKGIEGNHKIVAAGVKQLREGEKVLIAPSQD